MGHIRGSLGLEGHIFGTIRAISEDLLRDIWDKYIDILRTFGTVCMHI